MEISDTKKEDANHCHADSILEETPVSLEVFRYLFARNFVLGSVGQRNMLAAPLVDSQQARMGTNVPTAAASVR